MSDPIDLSEDILDSRDIIARIAYLEGTADPDEIAELGILRELAEQGESYAADWAYGETLIADAYFRDYAEELADDIGAVDKDAGWPLTYIDWDAAADALKQDYTAIEVAGRTFWTR